MKPRSTKKMRLNPEPLKVVSQAQRDAWKPFLPEPPCALCGSIRAELHEVSGAFGKMKVCVNERQCARRVRECG